MQLLDVAAKAQIAEILMRVTGLRAPADFGYAIGAVVADDAFFEPRPSATRAGFSFRRHVSSRRSRVATTPPAGGDQRSGQRSEIGQAVRNVDQRPIVELDRSEVTATQRLVSRRAPHARDEFPVRDRCVLDEVCRPEFRRARDRSLVSAKSGRVN
jgi:hypothetical protein